MIDLLRALRSGEALPGLVHQAVFVPEDALAQLRRHRPARMAVVDEYGDFTGLLTATDLVSELLGRRPGPEADPDLVRRADGGLAMHSLHDTLPLPELDEEDFSTLAGYCSPSSGVCRPWTRRWTAPTGTWRCRTSTAHGSNGC